MKAHKQKSKIPTRTSRKENDMKCEQHPSYAGKGVPRSRCTPCFRIYTQAHWSDGVDGIAQKLKVEPRTVKQYAKTLGLKEEGKEPISADERVKFDLKERRLKESKKESDQKYRALQEEITRLNVENEAIISLATPPKTFAITPILTGGGGEATCVVVASDWHIEETVRSSEVNDLNEYSLAIAKERATQFFKVALHLRNLEAKNTPVPTMVLAFLGDFITGNLDLNRGMPGNCSLEPTVAAYEAMGILASGIDFLLDNSDLNLVIPCHMGNHSRITKKPAHGDNESGNSLEYMVYAFLAQRYKDNDRVKFLISKAYTSYLDVYGVTLRLHHGHRIRFQGGVGGLTIPATKYIMRANIGKRAMYDVFGHHHQKQMGPNFICNGSMIGYTAYAHDEGFPFEPPSQTYFLINKRWNEIIDYRPILFS